MNQLETVLVAIDQIAATSKRGEKEALLREHLEHQLFRDACLYAYDPYRTYGIRPDADLEGTGTYFNDEFNPSRFFAFLDLLERRELTGNAAKETLDQFLSEMTPREGQLLVRILRKDLRAGFTANSVNRVRKGTIPEFKCMLAKKYEPKRIKNWPVAVEPKMDGVRVLIHCTGDGGVEIHSRAGHQDFAQMPNLVRELSEYGPACEAWIDGEITSGGFNQTVSDVRSQDKVLETAVLHVFECLLPEEFHNGSDETYTQRRENLNALDLLWEHAEYVKLTHYHLAYNDEQVREYYERFVAAGFEGVIVKPLEGKYEPKRSSNWLKIKGEETIDAPIVGYFEGEGKYKGLLGGFIVDVDGVHCNVGGGFSDIDRDYFWHNRPEIGTQIEVSFQEKTPDGSLRHPVFKRLRDDKPNVAAA